MLVTLLVAASAAQAQVAEAPAAAASNASAGADNPLGGNGFITVQGNKFVDADCKVSASLRSHILTEFRKSAAAADRLTGPSLYSGCLLLQEFLFVGGNS